MDEAEIDINSGNNKKRRRHTTDFDPLHGEDNTDARANRLALEPKIRRVSKQVVDARWAPLSDTAQKQVKEMFAMIERPVVMRVPDGKRRQEAQTAVGSVLKRLNARVPRMPFPPAAKDTHFDHEKLLDLNRTLESQLTPTIHSTSLLINEIEKEEQMLASENVRLKELEQEASDLEAQHQRQLQSSSFWKRLQQQNAADQGKKDASTHLASPSSLSSESVASGSVEDETGLAIVVEQVKPHLSSLQNNAAQVRGVSEEMMRARAAVDEVLYRKLEPEEYERLAAMASS